jgi:hypothetical protein
VTDAPVTRADVETVEALVRRKLAEALGGRRGMLEAAIPTVVFTVVFLTTRELRLAIGVSVALAVVALVARLVQRSTIQFTVNALLGIGIGTLFAMRAASAGGDADRQALGYFEAGLLYNGVYAVVLALSCLLRWPLVGFMVGSVTGELTAWRDDPPLRRLCSRLTWVLVAPCILRVAVQGPIWLAGVTEAMDPAAAVAALGISKLAMGWPLQLGALAVMVWLLSRNATPVRSVPVG